MWTSSRELRCLRVTMCFFCYLEKTPQQSSPEWSHVTFSFCSSTSKSRNNWPWMPFLLDQLVLLDHFDPPWQPGIKKNTSTIPGVNESDPARKKKLKQMGWGWVRWNCPNIGAILVFSEAKLLWVSVEGLFELQDVGFFCLTKVFHGNVEKTRKEMEKVKKKNQVLDICDTWPH